MAVRVGTWPFILRGVWLHENPVADLGEGPGGPGPPLFWVKKEEMTEGKMADRASKSRPPPPLCSREQGLDRFPHLRPPTSGPPPQAPYLKPPMSGPPCQAPHLRPPVSGPLSQAPYLRPPHLRPPISGPTISDPPSQAPFLRPPLSGPPITDPPSHAPISGPPFQTGHLRPQAVRDYNIRPQKCQTPHFSCETTISGPNNVRPHTFRARLQYQAPTMSDPTLFIRDYNIRPHAFRARLQEL